MKLSQGCNQGEACSLDNCLEKTSEFRHLYDEDPLITPLSHLRVSGFYKQNTFASSSLQLWIQWVMVIRSIRKTVSRQLLTTLMLSLNHTFKKNWKLSAPSQPSMILAYMFAFTSYAQLAMGKYVPLQSYCLIIMCADFLYVLLFSGWSQLIWCAWKNLTKK